MRRYKVVIGRTLRARTLPTEVGRAYDQPQAPSKPSATTADHFLSNASRSALTWSLSVEHRPPGAPLSFMTMNPGGPML